MRLQFRPYPNTKPNCEKYKKQHFAEDDKLTLGYLVGHATDDIRVDRLNKEIVDEYIRSLNANNKGGNLTSIFIRAEVNKRLYEIKLYLEGLYENTRAFPINEVIDVIMHFATQANANEASDSEKEWDETEMIFVQNTYKVLKLCQSNLDTRSFVIRANIILETALNSVSVKEEHNVKSDI